MVMIRFADPLLFVLFALLAASLVTFFLGVIPHPFGLIVLTAVIVARILYLQGPDTPAR